MMWKEGWGGLGGYNGLWDTGRSCDGGKGGWDRLVDCSKGRGKSLEGS